MITATRIILLIVSTLFYVLSMGTRNEKAGYFNLTAAVITSLLLLASIKMF